MEECIFCKIGKGEIPSRVIYEDDKIMAFLDITPYAQGHTLLIPKEHYRWLWDMPEDLTAHFFGVAQKIAKHYQEVTDDGLVYSLSIGTLVEHAHFHLVPNSNEKFKENLSNAVNDSRLVLNDDQFDEIYSKYKMDTD